MAFQLAWPRYIVLASRRRPRQRSKPPSAQLAPERHARPDWMAARPTEPDAAPWGGVALTGVGIRRSSRSLAVDGDRESGRRLRPGLGGEPEATPEPAVREQVAQPLDAQPDQADPARAGAGPGRGRGAQAGRRQAALARV